jgi:protein tyrosine phosphatase (PTP) superfamily phosphohydrolase (DUF442 family)
MITRLPHLISMLVCALGLVLMSRADAEEPPHLLAQRIADAPGVEYVAQVTPNLLRGAQPSARTIAWLKERGVKTVLNLRRFHGRSERERVLGAGMRYEHLPLEASDPPSDAQIERFLRLVTDPTLGPVYVHCAQGVDRTGTMMAIYRMEVEGWSNQAAFAEMKHFGANRIWYDLRQFVRRYRPQSMRNEAASVTGP